MILSKRVNPFRKAIAFVFFLLLIEVIPLLASAYSSRDVFIHEIASDSDIQSISADKKSIRARVVSLNTALLCEFENESLNTTGNGLIQGRPSLQLNLFDDVNLNANIDRIEKAYASGYSYVGKIEGIPDSEVVMVISGDIMSGDIRVPGHLYGIRYLSPGKHMIREVDQSKFGEELPPLVVPSYLYEDQPGRYIQPDPSIMAGPTIDVMVLYTGAARTAAGGTSAMVSTINLAVSETNTGYSNSGVSQRIRLVHSAEVSYDETGFDWSTCLDLLQGSGDGSMDEIHTLRNTYGADEVVLIVENGDYCGLGYMMTTVTSSFSSYAFCCVSRGCATGYYSLAHEMGHNMGCHHDRANASGQASYDYAYGYQAPDQSFRTIMAYNCTPSCTRVNYWSNPGKTYGGLPMGVAQGDPSAADNHLALNNTASTVASFRPTATNPTSSITVIKPNGGESLLADSSYSIQWSSSGSVGNVKIEYSTNGGSSWSSIVSSTSNSGSYSWHVPNTSSSQCKVRITQVSGNSPTDTSNAVFTIYQSKPPRIGLNHSQLNMGALTSGEVTNSQGLIITIAGGGSLVWSLSTDAAWLQCTPSSGTGSGIITVSANVLGLSAGTYSGNITIYATGADNSPVTVPVSLKVYNPGTTAVPFGEISTPVEGSTVRGSIAVTGWALDDVGVSKVEIFNGNSYVGDATFVDGARPDVEAAFPGYPQNSSAGWGYMLLTNFLPGGGNGTYTLIAKATDAEGHKIVLGSKTITCDNAHAVNPFGAIDTPSQGGTASGSNFVIFGWALTPRPNTIPLDGSTLNIWIDGVNIGHPTYNNYRSDIASLFPNYNNSNGAIGYYYLDTSAYATGVHTIQWTATDNAGNTDGIGSRYFTVLNSGADAPKQILHDNQAIPTNLLFSKGKGISKANVKDESSIILKKGCSSTAAMQQIYPDGSGSFHIQIKELEPIEIHFPVKNGSNSGDFSSLTCISNLPVGSTFDAVHGVFYWMPGPGFYGNYSFEFAESVKKNMGKISDSKNNKSYMKKIIISILPKFSNK